MLRQQTLYAGRAPARRPARKRAPGHITAVEALLRDLDESILQCEALLAMIRRALRTTKGLPRVTASTPCALALRQARHMRQTRAHLDPQAWT